MEEGKPQIQTQWSSILLSAFEQNLVLELSALQIIIVIINEIELESLSIYSRYASYILYNPSG